MANTSAGVTPLSTNNVPFQKVSNIFNPSPMNQKSLGRANASYSQFPKVELAEGTDHVGGVSIVEIFALCDGNPLIQLVQIPTVKILSFE